MFREWEAAIPETHFLVLLTYDERKLRLSWFLFFPPQVAGFLGFYKKISSLGSDPVTTNAQRTDGGTPVAPLDRLPDTHIRFIELGKQKVYSGPAASGEAAAIKLKLGTVPSPPPLLPGAILGQELACPSFSSLLLTLLHLPGSPGSFQADVQFLKELQEFSSPVSKLCMVNFI